MPIEVTINHDEQIVHATCHGKITLPDIQHYQHETWGSVKVKGYRELFDASKGDVSDFSIADAMTVADKGDENDSGANKTKTAIVISSERQKQLAIIYATKRGLNPDNPRTVEYFFTSSIALDWLLK